MSDPLNSLKSYHFKDGALYFQQHKVETDICDPDSFEILGDWHGKDKHHVY
ncbi:MAG: hypothetical protein HRU15_13415, partial [Planctomycetes bacterium]|nr:hypothetical protein [Planctomycetota bacterium]